MTKIMHETGCIICCPLRQKYTKTGIRASVAATPNTLDKKKGERQTGHQDDERKEGNRAPEKGLEVNKFTIARIMEATKGKEEEVFPRCSSGSAIIYDVHGCQCSSSVPPGYHLTQAEL